MVTFLTLPWWTVPLSSSVPRMKSTSYCPTSTLQKQMGLMTFQLECFNKETSLSITPIVTHLFNISITLGELPDEWKMARVSPIPKSGNHSDPGNYRSISLLSLLSKLLESTSSTCWLHTSKRTILSAAQQWGFTRGMSTTGALPDVTDHWHKELEQSHDICSICLL